MRGFIIVFNSEDGKGCMVSDGTVELEDLHGYKGIFIRKTIYRALELTLWQHFALWLLGLDRKKDAQDQGRFADIESGAERLRK